MSKPGLVRRVKAMFSSLMLSGLALVSSHAFAQEAPGEGSDNGQRTAQVEGLDLKPEHKAEKAKDTRGVNERVDDFFAEKYSVKVTRDSIWIAPPQRYEVRLMPLPENGLLNVTYEYLELKPLKKEWYGQARGIEYGIQAHIGKGSYTIGNAEWDFRTGANLGYYEVPLDYKREDGKASRYPESNSRAGIFIEGSRGLTLGGNHANLITGVSYSRTGGPDVGNGSDARVYTQLDLPALFSKASTPGDSASVGTFSGTVRAYAGTRTYGGELGIYFNNLKSDGKGVNYSAGPEIRYDKQGGVHYGFKFRVAPKFW